MTKETNTVKPLSTRARLAKIRVAVLPEVRGGTPTQFNKPIIGLPDVQPAFNKACNEHGVFSFGSIDGELFIFQVSSVDDASDVIEVRLPLVRAEMRGAQAIQNLGGSLTYLTRYALYQILGISSATEDPDQHQREDRQEQGPQSLGGYAPPFKPLSPSVQPEAVDVMNIPEDLPEPTALDRIAEINRFTAVKQLENYYKALPPAWKNHTEVLQALADRKNFITKGPSNASH